MWLHLPMSYTVQQLARLASISVRTLHYYDEIGLLKPSSIAKNGYRSYEQHELIVLQQILFFRELSFSLEDIKRMIHQPHFNTLEALQDQKQLLQLKRKRLNGLIKTIDHTIMTMTNHQSMNDNDLYDAFSDDDVKQYQEEVKNRWGNTDAYKQSMARVSKMTKQEMADLKEKGTAFTKTLAEHMDLPIDDPKVQALIKQHHQGIAFFYDCPLPMYRNLGQMYVDDPRFTAYYDTFRPGLAQFVRDAIAVYCDQQQHSETASKS